MAQREVLDTTSKSITAVMSGAAATTNPDFTATWADKTTTAFTPGDTNGAFTGATPITIVAAPAASTQRIVHSINIYNRDSAAVTITLRKVDGANTRVIKAVTLAVGDQCTLDGTYDDDGALKTGGASGGSMSTFDIDADSGTAETVTNGDTVIIAGGTGLTSAVSATNTVTVNLDDTAVTPGSYTYSSLTVDAQGRLTSASSGAAPAPSNATYITQVAESGLSAEQALASLSTGLMKVTTTTGVVSSVTDSAGLAGCLSDETGSGAAVFGTSPTITTPRIVTSVLDTNGNEILDLVATGSAVNNLGVTNAAAAGTPVLSAAGADTDIGIALVPKGTGIVTAGGVAVVTTTGTQTLTNKTLTAPTIADFTNAVHDHLDNDDGGTLSGSAIASGTVAAARLGVMTGDSGAGGASGAAPAPGAGDAAALKFLKADATWAVPSGSGAMTQLVAWTVLGADTASVSLSSISGSYKHLFLTIRIRTDHSSGDDALIRFNADTTVGNYYGVFNYVTQTVTGAISNAGAVATIAPTGGWVGADNATAGYFTDYWIWIMDYTSTSRFKIFNMLSLVPIGTTNFNHVTGGGHWLNSADAITAISIAPRNGSNLRAGTGYGLWGVV